MHKNNWSEGNTTAAIGAIGGIAGALINKKASGNVLSAAQAELAKLALQTEAALAKAEQAAPPQGNNLLDNKTLLFGGIALLVIIGLVFFFKK